jgi:V/A-type H+-transporting ATPase subunit G/H
LLKYYIGYCYLSFSYQSGRHLPSLRKGGDTMSMLEDIKNAEQKADDLKKQAALEARNTVRDAQAEAHKEADALIAEARKQAAAAIAQAEAQAKQEADALVAENRKRDEAQAAEARKNLDAAVQYIMKKVVIEC